MTIFDAVQRLAARPIDSRGDVFDAEFTFMDADAWPEAAAAAVDLAGMLEDAETDADLDAGLEHFQSLHSSEVFSTQQLREETVRVIHTVGRELMERGLLEAA